MGQQRLQRTAHCRYDARTQAPDGRACGCLLALPGGIGTFEEFFEVWTWRQLGYHDKPVGLLNQNGYYDLLVTFLQSTVTQGFMGDWQMGLIRIGDQAEDLLRELVQAAGLAPESHLDQI